MHVVVHNQTSLMRCCQRGAIFFFPVFSFSVSFELNYQRTGEKPLPCPLCPMLSFAPAAQKQQGKEESETMGGPCSVYGMGNFSTGAFLYLCCGVQRATWLAWLSGAESAAMEMYLMVRWNVYWAPHSTRTLGRDVESWLNGVSHECRIANVDWDRYSWQWPRSQGEIQHDGLLLQVIDVCLGHDLSRPRFCLTDEGIA